MKYRENNGVMAKSRKWNDEAWKRKKRKKAKVINNEKWK